MLENVGKVAEARREYVQGTISVAALAEKHGISQRQLERYAADESWRQLRTQAREAAIELETEDAAEWIKAHRPHHIKQLIQLSDAAAQTAIREFDTVGGDAIAASAATRSSIDSAKRVEDLAGTVGQSTGLGQMRILVQQGNEQKQAELPATSSTSTASSTNGRSNGSSNGHSKHYPRKGGSS